MRLFASLLLLALGSAAALAEPAHTTRIETRPYYGAVVTIEQGVRVYRPVPPTQHLSSIPTARRRCNSTSAAAAASRRKARPQPPTVEAGTTARA